MSREGRYLGRHFTPHEVYFVQIPKTIDEWRKIYDDGDESFAYWNVWIQFKELFEQAGFRLYRKRSNLILAPPLEDEVTPGPSGYAYLSSLNPSLAAMQWERFNLMVSFFIQRNSHYSRLLERPFLRPTSRRRAGLCRSCHDGWRAGS